jgi:hypothetical protein
LRQAGKIRTWKYRDATTAVAAVRGVLLAELLDARIRDQVWSRLGRVARTNSVCREQLPGFHGETAAMFIWNAL